MTDTNILLYAHDYSNEVKREPAIAVLDHLTDVQAGTLSTQILGEFFVNVQPRSSRRATVSIFSSGK